MSKQDESGTIDLPRRKMLGAIGAVGVGSAAGGLGTSAFFSDEEQFTGNEMIAGELDLKVDWEEHYSDWSSDEMALMDDDGNITDLPAFMETTLVESFPDQDNNAIQDPISDPPCGPNSNLADADLPQVLSSDLRTEGTFAGQETVLGDPLINLKDVKPGDSGEVTFSFHLCDNPGFVWLTGGLTENAENGVNEPESNDLQEDDPFGPDSGNTWSGELAEEIEVRVWYDPDCDNVRDDGESIIFEWGTLKEVMDSLNDGTLLSRTDFVDASEPSSGDDGSTDAECDFLGKLEWIETDGDDDPDNNYFTPEDGTRIPRSSPPADPTDDDLNGIVGDKYEFTHEGETVVILLEDVKYKEGDPAEPIEVEFRILDEESKETGFCRVDIQASDETKTVFELSPDSYCVSGLSMLSTDEFMTGTTGQQPAISNIQLWVCDQTPGTPPLDIPQEECFQPNETYCIGFEWRLPVNHANEIQTDSVAFDLGFYTEQCRHNDGSGGPPDRTPVTLREADATPQKFGTTTTTSQSGSGSWQSVGTDKEILYLGPDFVDFPTLPAFTVDEIEEISYYTNKGYDHDPNTSPNPSGAPVDFYLLIYTEPQGDYGASSGIDTDPTTDDASWYDKRLNAEPYYLNLAGDQVNAPANQWNEWSTSGTGNTDPLRFVDANRPGVGLGYGDGTMPTLADLQAGSINWSALRSGAQNTSIDYGSQTVKTLAISTGSAWNSSFDGLLDNVVVRLTGGAELVVDLEQ